MSYEQIGVIAAVILVVAAAVYFFLGRKGRDHNGDPHVDPQWGKKNPVDLKDIKKDIQGNAGADAGKSAGEGTPDDGAGRDAAGGGEGGQPESAGPVPPLPVNPLLDAGVRTEQPDIDQMTEVVVRLRCDRPFSAGQAMLASQSFTSQVFPTPVRIQVCNEFDRLWGPVQRTCSYTEMIISMQLASRTAVVDELAASNFSAAVQQAAETLDAEADVIDVPDIVAQAKEVRKLIDRYGMRITIAVNSPVPASSYGIEGIARAAGFEVSDGKMLRRDGDSQTPWLRLFAHPQNPQMLLVELVPALCLPSSNPLASLFTAANDIAARVNGAVTDPSGNPLDAAARVTTGRQLRVFYAAMAKQGLDAGTRRVKRLFS